MYEWVERKDKFNGYRVRKENLTIDQVNDYIIEISNLVMDSITKKMKEPFYMNKEKWLSKVLNQYSYVKDGELRDMLVYLSTRMVNNINKNNSTEHIEYYTNEIGVHFYWVDESLKHLWKPKYYSSSIDKITVYYNKETNFFVEIFFHSSEEIEGYALNNTSIGDNCSEFRPHGLGPVNSFESLLSDTHKIEGVNL